MGQCGCGDGFGHYKFRGDGGWYVLQLYAGCEDCHTPAGVQILFYDDASDIIDCIEDVPDFTAKLKDMAVDGLFLPVFDFHKLVESEAVEEMESPGEYEKAKDFVGDMHYAVRMAAVDTINDTLQKVRV